MTTYNYNMNDLQDYNMAKNSNNYEKKMVWKRKNEIKEYNHSLKKVEDFPRVYKMPLAEALNKKDIIKQQLKDWDYTTEWKWPYGPYVA